MKFPRGPVAKSSSSIAEAASWIEKRFAKLRRSDEEVPEEGPRYGIELRRFAGPRAYRRRLGHARIAHLTDLHVGRVTPFAVQKAAVDMTNAERPDLVVLPGDFVCHSQLWLDQLVEVVSGFKAPTIAVLGNHDHWSGADEVEAALKRAGVEVLRNRNTTVTLGHERLQVVGLDDAYTGHARLEEAVKGLRRDLPTLALSHIAEEADGLWKRGIPLVLSGHTHGGQVTVARLHELSLGKIGGHKYLHGLYGSREARGHHLRAGRRAGRAGRAPRRAAAHARTEAVPGRDGQARGRGGAKAAAARAASGPLPRRLRRCVKAMRAPRGAD